MNIILLEPHEVTENRAKISDYRCKHINKVLRAKTDDTLRVGIIGGNMGTAVIKEISKHEVSLQIISTYPPPQKANIKLILALPRPIILKRVIAQATALGINAIHIINARRVEKSFFNATLLKNENFRPYILNGLEQAIDTILPTITVHKKFKPFIEDYAPPKLPNEQRLIAHPLGGVSLSTISPLPKDQTLTLAIGPEGGWIDYEVDRFKETEFTPLNLGPRILRVDTAVPAIIAQLCLLKELSTS